jgi:membrane-associated protease RseP (regulator of RpoE activity)
VAFEQLTNDLRPQRITPMFRMDEGQHAILLVPHVFEARPSNPWINVVLLGLTFFSALLTGAQYASSQPADSLSGYFASLLGNLWSGWPFALSLMTILLFHEFGHYFAGRLHRVHLTLPYFIPLPFLSLLGTMGAVILWKEPPKNRRILLDIGLAGPLAGLVVAIPILLYGLATSYTDQISIPPGQGIQLEGNSILYLLSKLAVFGQLLPAPASYGGENIIEYWLRYFFTGRPLPVGGTDVMLNQVAWAGWAGLLLTALNLIPAGTLDGGHVLYSLGGRWAKKLLPIILVTLLLLGLVFTGWWLWAFLIFFLGRMYAEPLDQITPLNMGRKVMAVIGIIVFILIFIPVPLIIVTNAG